MFIQSGDEFPLPTDLPQLTYHPYLQKPIYGRNSQKRPLIIYIKHSCISLEVTLKKQFISSS